MLAKTYCIFKGIILLVICILIVGHDTELGYTPDKNPTKDPFKPTQGSQPSHNAKECGKGCIRNKNNTPFPIIMRCIYLKYSK